MTSTDPILNGHATARAAINRENAQHSTGPRTESGKRRASLNALRHGLTGHTVVLPTDDHAAYERHSQDLSDEYQPKSATEKQLVQELIDTSWRLNRITALETNLLSLGLDEQFNTINVSNSQAQHALAMAAAYRAHAREFANLSMYSQRLSRQFQKVLDQLREMQAERRKKQNDQLPRAAELMELHEQEEDTPYDPAADGFDFSTADIQTYLDRRARADRAFDATDSPETDQVDEQVTETES